MSAWPEQIEPGPLARWPSQTVPKAVERLQATPMPYGRWNSGKAAKSRPGEESPESRYESRLAKSRDFPTDCAESLLSGFFVSDSLSQLNSSLASLALRHRLIIQKVIRHFLT